MQAALDEYLIAYNTRRPHQGRGMNGRTPERAFRDGIPCATMVTLDEQTVKTAA